MSLTQEKILLGLKIKNFRKNCSYTQEKLSEVLGIDVSALSKIENGKSFPSAETICKLIRILKISPNELFDFVTCNKDKQKIEKDIFLESVKLLSDKEKQKVLKFIEILKD